MADRNPEDFDPTRKLAMTRGALLNGHSLARLAPVRVVDDATDRPGEIEEPLARRLWGAGTLDYAEDLVATAVEDPETGVAALIETDDLGGGWYQLRAPWRAEAVKVQGQDKVPAERAKLIKEGLGQIDLRRPPDTQLFTIEEAGSNGYFLVHGPGLDEPLKVRGEQQAMSKRDELERAAATPPPGAGGNMSPPPPPDSGADRTTNDELAGAAKGDEDE